MRCPWSGVDELYIAYHDDEWGKPLHDDNRLFEMLILEGMQAGLSWLTILRKREAFRLAFDMFNPNVVANYDEQKIEALLNNKDIIRNKRKIIAAINNAKVFLEVQSKYSSFDDFIWKYVDNKQIINHWKKHGDIPVFTDLAQTISNDLKKLGFKFVGPTIIYSFMQAIGMVNDHTTNCFCYSGKAIYEKK